MHKTQHTTHSSDSLLSCVSWLLFVVYMQPLSSLQFCSPFPIINQSINQIISSNKELETTCRIGALCLLQWSCLCCYRQACCFRFQGDTGVLILEIFKQVARQLWCIPSSILPLFVSFLLLSRFTCTLTNEQ